MLASGRGPHRAAAILRGLLRTDEGPHCRVLLLELFRRGLDNQARKGHSFSEIPLVRLGRVLLVEVVGYYPENLENLAIENALMRGPGPLSTLAKQLRVFNLEP